MQIPNLLFVALLASSLLYGTSCTKHKTSINIVITFSLVCLISLFIGFRSPTSGTDTKEYLYYFYHVDSLSGHFEIGFEWITLIFSVMGQGQIYLFAICAATLSMLSVAAHKSDSNHFLVISLSLSFLHGLDLITNGIRNALGISFAMLLLAYLSSISRPILLGTLSPIAATIFHSSCVIFSPLFALSRAIFNNRGRLLALFFASILAYQASNLFGIDLLRGIALLYTDNTGPIGKAARYVLLDNELLTSWVKFYFFANGAVLSFICAYYFNNIQNTQTKVFAGISVIGFFISSTLYFSAFSYRFFILFFLPQILVVTHLLSRNRLPKRARLLITSFVVFNLIATYSTQTYWTMSLFSVNQ